MGIPSLTSGFHPPPSSSRRSFLSKTHRVSASRLAGSQSAFYKQPNTLPRQSVRCVRTPRRRFPLAPPAFLTRPPARPPAPTPSAHCWPLLICRGQILEMAYEWLHYHRNETDVARATSTSSQFPPAPLPLLPSSNMIAWYRREEPEDKDNAWSG